MKKRRRRKINEISILQKYSSNKFLQNSIISQLNISILQKYSSNRMKTNKEIAHKIYFNTTKVLFKRLSQAACRRGRKRFQYYKSTLQTEELKRKQSRR